MFFYNAFGLTLQSELALSALAAQPPATADVTIRRATLPKPIHWFTTKISRAGLQARFSQPDTGEYWLNWEPISVFRATAGDLLEFDSSCTDNELLELFTLSEALGLLLFQRGYFLLHGSAVTVRDEGVVFLGEPGAGKSTTAAAFARQGFPLLSDDLVCIWLDTQGTPWLIPAFSQLKLWQRSVEGLRLETATLRPVREGSTKFGWHSSVPFDAQPVRLARIYVLQPPAEGPTTFVTLPSVRSPIELLSHFPLPDALLQGETLKKHFQQSTKIARHTPLIRMHRPANYRALADLVTNLSCMDRDENE